MKSDKLFPWCVGCGRDKDKCSCAEEQAAREAKAAKRAQREAEKLDKLQK